jgi:hypothetical protein
MGNSLCCEDASSDDFEQQMASSSLRNVPSLPTTAVKPIGDSVEVEPATPRLEKPLEWTADMVTILLYSRAV